jgi:hypothetical protein
MHGSNGVFNLAGAQQVNPATVNLQVNLIIARLIIIIVRLT